jgi:CRP/FNR family cyclic AMP-dependent transcriptional regulator
MARDFSAGFFNYPVPEIEERTGGLTFLGDRPKSDWATLLEHTETRRFSQGDEIVRAGDVERALYLLTRGALATRVPGSEISVKRIEPPSVVGEVAFLDGGRRLVSLVAITDGEHERLSMQSFEVLAARHPDLGRAILLDLGRIVARRLRHATEYMGGRNLE